MGGDHGPAGVLRSLGCTVHNAPGYSQSPFPTIPFPPDLVDRRAQGGGAAVDVPGRRRCPAQRGSPALRGLLGRRASSCPRARGAGAGGSCAAAARPRPARLASAIVCCCRLPGHAHEHARWLRPRGLLRSCARGAPGGLVEASVDAHDDPPGGRRPYGAPLPLRALLRST